MKKGFISVLCIALAFIACQSPDDSNNKTLDYSDLTVKFNASIENRSWPENAKVGVIATCNTEANAGVSMSVNPIAEYVVANTESKTNLVNVSDNDLVKANATNHNFNFYAVYPLPSSSVGTTAIPVGVAATQSFADGVMNSLTFVAHTVSTTVIPTIEFSMKPIYSVIELNIPNDIIEGQTTTLKSLTLKPTTAENFGGSLSESGSYNLITETYTPNTASSSTQVSMSFGNEGLLLSDAYTVIGMVVTPFTVPEGGMTLTLVDADNVSTDIEILNQKSDEGKELKSGDNMTVYVSGISDGIVPCTFPVSFPLGYIDGVGYNTATAQNQWCNASDKRGEGIFKCLTQTQAYAQWVWGEASASFSPAPFLESVNSKANLISTVGVKGAWTGDYLEFIVPVRKFAAGTNVQLSMPICAKNAPIFWEVMYLDGEEWKTTAKSITASDGVTSAVASWAIPYNTSPLLTQSMKFEKAIKSGYLKIRVRCVDGSIVATASGADGKDTIITITEPAKNSAGTARSGNFYFVEKDQTTLIGKTEQAITISIL